MRSEDDILKMVRERAQSIRRRRHAVAGTTVVIALIAVLAVVFSPADGGERDVVTADEPSRSTTTRETTTEPGEEDSESSTSTSTTSLDGTTTTSAPAVEPPPTVSTPPTTTAETEPPPCDGPSLASSVAVERATYSPGETIRVSFTMSNSSGAPCWVSARYLGGPCLPSVEFAHDYEGDEPGRVHDWFSASYNRSSCADREIIPPHGQITVWVEAPFTGSRQSPGPEATDDPPPSGTYQVYANWPAEQWVQGGQTTFTCPEPQCTPAPDAS